MRKLVLLCLVRGLAQNGWDYETRWQRGSPYRSLEDPKQLIKDSKGEEVTGTFALKSLTHSCRVA
jgi:hypothetical protein